MTRDLSRFNVTNEGDFRRFHAASEYESSSGVNVARLQIPCENGHSKVDNSGAVAENQPIKKTA